LAAIGSGAAALLWFLIRVIPKPSRAAYPCQRAAFPAASAFVIWACGILAIKSWTGRLAHSFGRHRLALGCLGTMTVLGLVSWTLISGANSGTAAAGSGGTDWNFVPTKPNESVGVARGINPGRVVWAHDPKAARWSGHWQEKSDQYWLDANTDQGRVDAMLAATLLRLTSTSDGERAWKAIFEYYNKNSRGMEHRGYQSGEVVAVKINLNNSEDGVKADNYTDATPQTVLAMVHQLVNQAHVQPKDILVYDVRRVIPPYMLTKVWGEFKDVRFIQGSPPKQSQPKNPGYGDYHGLETPEWVEGVVYSNGKYKDAKLIPKQVFDATYLVNLALLKAHSYPYNTREDGDAGQTAVSMAGKNHFGSIKGTWELHAAINTDQEGVKNAYSPMVDLAASPNLGAKTILFVLDGLYSGRKWRTYPMHFPNPPFNNRVEPYENPDWPSSILASMDGVALDSVGLDILFAQTKNNNDADGRPRILIRANADDYLFEMAEPDHAPSGTVYTQNGKPVTSLGAHERWDGDATRRYSRNLDPVHGKGIELVYMPMGDGNQGTPLPGKAANDGPQAPAVCPGKGAAQHPFLYAGEWDTRKPQEQSIFIVREGKIVWQYSMPIKTPTGGNQEFDDATLLSNGNVIFSRMSGAGMVSPEKRILWDYPAPPGTEIHSCQSIGKNRVLIMRNGNPAQAMIINTATGTVEKEIPIPTPVIGTHGQFRHIRMTKTGTLLVPHLGEGKVVEYDLDGKVLWSVLAKSPWHAVRLKNGNTLIAGDWSRYAREVNPKGETVWEFAQADVPGFKLGNIQTAHRLANGNTVMCCWIAGDNNTSHWPGTVQVFEAAPDKSVVWALSSWKDPDLGPATHIQLLDEPDALEDTPH
jgi:hypothetical protein